MSAPDFAAIIGVAMVEPKSAVQRGLEAKVAGLCQTCGDDLILPACPDCPTIGQLLAIGAAVMTAQEEANTLHTVSVEGRPGTHVAYVLLDNLRAVQP